MGSKKNPLSTALGSRAEKEPTISGSLGSAPLEILKTPKYIVLNGGQKWLVPLSSFVPVFIRVSCVVAAAAPPTPSPYEGKGGTAR